MNYENFRPGFNKPTIITGAQYDHKVIVEIDHSDTDIDVLFDAFETICTGLGYHKDSWKQWIMDRADEYKEEDEEENGAKDMGMVSFTKEQKKVIEDYVATLPKVNYEEEDAFFGKYTTDCYCGHTDKCDCGPEDGDRYRATDEDEDEFDDYGMRTIKDRVGFEWGDEEEDIEPLFDGDEFEPNENLKAANERYKNEVKKTKVKQKQNDNKKKKRNTNG